MSMDSCVFCAIAAGDEPAVIVREWDDTIAILPLNPVTAGHRLVLPRAHVSDFFSDLDVSATTMRRVGELVRHDGALVDRDYNVITSAGPAATQTVMHLHVHLIPRFFDDGLYLPWTEHIGGSQNREGGP